MYNYKPKETGTKTQSKNQIYVNSTGVTIATDEEGAVLLMVLTGADPYKVLFIIFLKTEISNNSYYIY